MSAKRKRDKDQPVCDNLSFAAAEAYKLLRTNLLFALPEKKCRVLGISSAVRGEGKSTTAVNLSYALAATGKHVLLIDADMRLPSVADKLSLPQSPGLSNLLAGMCRPREALVPSSYFKNWYILPAGDPPPNPSELLGSWSMRSFLEKSVEVFDFIVLDLPPINIVADALVVAPWLDGLALVIRQNYTDRRALGNCMYQIRSVDAKFLGFVITDANGAGDYGSSYGRYGYGYGRYSRSYGYEDADRHRSPGKGAPFSLERDSDPLSPLDERHG